MVLHFHQVLRQQQGAAPACVFYKWSLVMSGSLFDCIFVFDI
jgi:hypothetical protein